MVQHMRHDMPRIFFDIAVASSGQVMGLQSYSTHQNFNESPWYTDCIIRDHMVEFLVKHKINKYILTWVRKSKVMSNQSLMVF